MSDFSQSNLSSNKAPKTKAEYSRNIKKLKVKLMTIEQEVNQIQKKIRAFSNTSNDKMIALKISKFCKERRITPEMLYRCADRSRKKSVTKGQFKETLIGLGLKLTQHQLTRLEYLLDEDISGEISEKQYNQFLIAFRIKGQFSAEQQFINQIFKKVIDTNIEDNQNKDPNNKNRHLLNYQQFLKYCHRHLPHMKHKQIASIFNILQRNNMIDIDQFLQYIKKKKQQSKELENKNKKNQLKKLELTDIEKLKGIIKNILNNRKDPTRPIFHSFEFSKLQRDLKKQRGQLLQLFKQIDKQRKGSFGFNQLIQYYIDKTKDKEPEQIVYAYEIMGIKLSVDKEKPEDVLNRYNGGPANKKINLDSFKKFMLKQFGVIESDAEAVFRVLSKRDNEIPIRVIIDAMKLSESQKKTIYIKPTLWNTESKDFWRKNSMTILFNPFVALRFCLIIVEELKKAEQTYWDDYQFGPTFEDPFGSESIGFESISVDAVKWLTVESLGMKQFYPNEDKQKIKFISTNQCPHDKFTKTLCQLIKSNQLVIESSEVPDYKVKNVQDANLRHLFQGLYPLIFRSFAAFGIYVFRFYSRQKWVYVITDNKIPCTTYNQPLFSQSIQKKHSWISLIQKGYAKLRGNYAKLFNVNSNSQYIHELNRKIPIKYLMGKQLKSAEQKNKFWQLLMTVLSERKGEKVYGLVSDSAVSQLIQAKVETGFQSNVLNQIIAAMEIQDQKCQNQHKSHRLTLIKADLANIKMWNPNWNSGEDENKYDRFLDQIQQDMRKKQMNPGLLRYKNINVINFKLFRNIFNQIFALRSFSFEKTIILRKIAQFEQKFSCRYELNSKQPNQRPLKIYITLNRIRGPADTTIQIILKSTPPKQQAKLIHTEYIRKNFGACELTIGQQLHTLQIKVQNWHQNQDHVYTMTFYMDNPMYHMRQLDRQQLFRYVGQYQEMAYLDIKQADQKERLYIYRNYFKAAERGNGCCG